MSATYSEAQDKFNQIREEMERRENNPPQLREMEAYLRDASEALVHVFMQGWMENIGAKEKQRDDVVAPDGTPLPYARESQQKVMTIFGEVIEYRLGYSAPGKESVFPMDKQLNLPARKYSHALQEREALKVVNLSYDETVKQIDRETGGHIPKRQAEQVAVEYAQDFDPFYGQRVATGSYQASEDFLALSLDGKGVVMLRNDLREETRRRAEQSAHKLEARLSPGEKHNRKRMATVAAVYSVDAYVRTPVEVMDKNARDQLPPAPKPVDKRVWASLEKTPAQVLDDMIDEAKRRDPEGKLKWVFLVDGSKEQLRQVNAAIKRHKLKATIILDFVHVLEYLWTAAWCFFKKGDEAVEKWVLDRALEILRGKCSAVAGGMKRSATCRGLPRKKRLGIDSCARYLKNNRRYLRYVTALKQGMPITTAVIEGTCKNLVRRRAEGSGAQWSLRGAEAVLRLRAIYLSGDWDKYSAFHREQDQRRNYPEYVPGNSDAQVYTAKATQPFAA